VLFVVKNLKASRINLLMNDFAAGLPSPLAFLGLAAAIAPVLNAPRWDIGVLPILHAVHVSEGRTKAEAAPWRKRDEFKPVEIPEDLVGSATVSLLLDLPNASDEHQVAAALLGRRIAGGVIENDEINVSAVAADGTAFSKLSCGYAMIRAEPPKSELISTGAIDQLKAIAAELYPAERKAGSGWHVPVAVGHRLLEDLDTVPKSRSKKLGFMDKGLIWSTGAA
jgi:hypothetical protein